MFPIIPVVILVIRVLAATQQGAGGGRQEIPTYARTWRSILWGLLCFLWLPNVSIAFVTSHYLFVRLFLSHKPIEIEAIYSLAVFGPLTILGATVIFFAWPILRWLARRGRPKLVYYLAHFALLFPKTGETYSGASLLAILALAHRGGATKAERDWVQKRIAKERRHLGTYATACALHQMLEARAARDEGRRESAADHEQRARTLLGTITYMSDYGVPRGVRKVAYEILALDDARQGHWGSLEHVDTKFLTPLSRVLRGWAHQWFVKPISPNDDILNVNKLIKREKKEARAVEKARKSIGSPILDGLFIRPREPTPPQTAHSAWARTRRDFVALLRGDRFVSPRAIMAMLGGLDYMLSPECSDNVLPAAVRSHANSEELLSSLHDLVAQAIAEHVSRSGAPIHRMDTYGPISARVHQLVETSLFNEMDRALAALDERTSLGIRNEPFDEWCEVSYVRSIYRRIEISLGRDSVGQLWPRFVYRYCKLGVDLSEMYPRMRPLAHAVFRCLSSEAVRWEDQVNIKQQSHNMVVTSGVD